MAANPETDLPDDVESEGDIPDKLYFRIGEVAELVGVEPHVLRYWEGEFRMRPHRSSSGQRLYRRRDIARFLKIKRLLHAEGFTIAGARKALAPRDASDGDAGPGLAVDLAQLREAADRLNALRGSLASFRAELDRLDAGADER